MLVIIEIVLHHLPPLSASLLASISLYFLIFRQLRWSNEDGLGLALDSDFDRHEAFDEIVHVFSEPDLE